VLFLLFGSSGAGKTTVLAGLRGRVERLALHDFDEIGVPPAADTAWRQRANECWLRRALGEEAQGRDLLLAGQTPLGELLAAPAAVRLAAISACLLDCDDATRLARLRARDPAWLETIGAPVDDYLAWAAWMRRHAVDPGWQQDVIRVDGTDADMRWSRWIDWRAGDPRWRIRIIDTSEQPVGAVVAELVDWVRGERALLAAGRHPLTGATLERA
jgi:hypothetical protein